VKQLSALDANFLHMETATTVGHVSSLNIYDPTGAPGGGGYEATMRLVAERIDQLAPLTRRLVEVPFGLDLPYWVEDPNFDLDFHIRHHAVPPPGNDQQLSEVISRIVARPLDKTRPLWELYVIEGLEGGRIAQLTKVHHATIDGAAGAQMLMALLDPDPDWRPSAKPVDAELAVGASEPLPTSAELLRRTAVEYLRRPEKALRLNLRLARQLASGPNGAGIKPLADLVAQPIPGALGNMLRRRLRSVPDSEVDTPPALPSTPAPRTPWNAAITAHRRFAFTTLTLDDAKVVRRAYGTTFNDVVMALCSGALRTYLTKHDALPADPLIAMVPVSLRTGSESETYQNRVSMLLAELATDEPDPVKRLMRIRSSMNSAKEMHAAMPAETLMDLGQFAPPAIAARATRLALRTAVDRMHPPFNLTISNVPGPQMPLYSAGARLLHFYPVSIVTDGQGLNMTVQSYNGNLDFGFIVCRDLVPDVWDLCDYLHDAMKELLATC